MMFKFVQRRTYSFLNTWSGFAFIVILTYALIAYTITVLFYDPCINSNCSRSSNSNSNIRHFYDNIGNINGELELAYGPIDAVYTWVNGSDNRWLDKKEKWFKMHLEALINKTTSININLNTTSNSNTTSIYSNNTIANNATIHTNQTYIHYNNNSTNNSTDETNVDEEDVGSANRYRDSEELRYSLRSLVKNAPWIRRIYIVTDNQIPYWLNLENERVSVISHEEIFLNKSHLPVFSSPAIEANIHRIPGLSKQFIYFNDDVFLGSKTHPEDFVSLLGIPKFYLSWEVPKCAPGCSDSWIGDGYCDKACNVSACDFDYPDCINSTLGIPNTNNNNRPTVAFCARGCPHSWLGDKVCDLKCKSEECGWDLGDCGLDLLLDFNNVTISYNNSHIIKLNRNESSYVNVSSSEFQNLHINNNTSFNDTAVNDELYAIPIALRVGYGTKAVYFNISKLPCYALSIDNDDTHDKQDLPLGLNYTSSNTACDFSDFTITTINHNYLLPGRENSLVQSFTIIKRNQIAGVILHHGQEDAPPCPPLPFREMLTIEGYNVLTNISITASFVLEVYESSYSDSSNLVDVNRFNNTSDNTNNTVVESHISINTSDSIIDVRRRLLDTYGSSLVYVNKLYRKKFGSESRRVPAHMPHFLDIEMVENMHNLLPHEWNLTSSNKFRDPNDMQFAFSYYYYSMNRYKDKQLNLTTFINREIDTNYDGLIDDNEFRTLVTTATGKSPNEADLSELHKCATAHLNITSNSTENVLLAVSDILSCNTIENGLRVHPMWSRWAPTHTLGQDKDVSFEMIGDNATETIIQLDSVRSRLSKFICINDNMKNPTPEMVKTLNDFFEALFPIPSQFELPRGKSNPTLYLDEYKKLDSSITNRIHNSKFVPNKTIHIAISDSNTMFHLLLLWLTVAFCWILFIRKR